MKELLCIKSHPNPKGVKAGVVYQAKKIFRLPCCNEEVVIVGILNDGFVGSGVTDCSCGIRRRAIQEDKYWLFGSFRFAEIGTTDELEQYPQEKTANI